MTGPAGPAAVADAPSPVPPTSSGGAAKRGSPKASLEALPPSTELGVGTSARRGRGGAPAPTGRPLASEAGITLTDVAIVGALIVALGAIATLLWIHLFPLHAPWPYVVAGGTAATLLALYATLVRGVHRVGPHEEAYTSPSVRGFRRVMGPGLHFVNPFGRVYTADLRAQVLDLPVREMMTKDGLPVKVQATLRLRVVDGSAALRNVEDYRRASLEKAQSILPAAVGVLDIRGLIREQARVGMLTARAVAVPARQWGVLVETVEIRSIDPGPAVQQLLGEATAAELEAKTAGLRADMRSEEHALRLRMEQERAETLRATSEVQRQAEQERAETLRATAEVQRQVERDRAEALRATAEVQRQAEREAFLLRAMEAEAALEREQRAVIERAETERRARLLEADAWRQKRVLEAEGERQAGVLRAIGQAQELQVLAAAASHLDTQVLPYLRTERALSLALLQSNRLLFPAGVAGLMEAASLTLAHPTLELPEAPPVAQEGGPALAIEEEAGGAAGEEPIYLEEAPEPGAEAAGSEASGAPADGELRADAKSVEGLSTASAALGGPLVGEGGYLSARTFVGGSVNVKDARGGGGGSVGPIIIGGLSGAGGAAGEGLGTSSRTITPGDINIHIGPTPPSTPVQPETETESLVQKGPQKACTRCGTLSPVAAVQCSACGAGWYVIPPVVPPPPPPPPPPTPFALLIRHPMPAASGAAAVAMSPRQELCVKVDEHLRHAQVAAFIWGFLGLIPLFIALGALLVPGGTCPYYLPLASCAQSGLAAYLLGSVVLLAYALAWVVVDFRVYVKVGAWIRSAERLYLQSVEEEVSLWAVLSGVFGIVLSPFLGRARADLLRLMATCPHCQLYNPLALREAYQYCTRCGNELYRVGTPPFRVPTPSALARARASRGVPAGSRRRAWAKAVAAVVVVAVAVLAFLYLVPVNDFNQTMTVSCVGGESAGASLQIPGQVQVAIDWHVAHRGSQSGAFFVYQGPVGSSDLRYSGAGAGANVSFASTGGVTFFACVLPQGSSPSSMTVTAGYSAPVL